MEAKSELLLNWSNEMWNCSHQKRNSSFKLCQADIEFSLLSSGILASCDVLSVLVHTIAADALHKHTEYILQVVELSQVSTSHMDGTVLPSYS